MAVETIKKRASQIALENGTDSQGNVKTVNISLSGLSKDGWDADKYLAIVAALEPCLSNSVNSANMVATYNVTAN